MEMYCDDHATSAIYPNTQGKVEPYTYSGMGPSTSLATTMHVKTKGRGLERSLARPYG